MTTYSHAAIDNSIIIKYLLAFLSIIILTSMAIIMVQTSGKAFFTALSFDLRDHNPWAWFLLICFSLYLTIIAVQLKQSGYKSYASLLALCIAALITLAFSNPYLYLHDIILITVSIISTLWLITIAIKFNCKSIVWGCLCCMIAYPLVSYFGLRQAEFLHILFIMGSCNIFYYSRLCKPDISSYHQNNFIKHLGVSKLIIRSIPLVITLGLSIYCTTIMNQKGELDKMTYRVAVKIEKDGAMRAVDFLRIGQIVTHSEKTKTISDADLALIMQHLNHPLRNGEEALASNQITVLNNLCCIHGYQPQQVDKILYAAIPLLKSEKKHVRYVAAYTIGKLQDKRGIQYLKPLLKDNDPEVADRARKAINTLKHPSR